MVLRDLPHGADPGRGRAARPRRHRLGRSSPERASRLRSFIGAGDQRRLSSSAAAYHIVPDARVEVLPGVGHTPMLEDPQTTGRLLLDFAAAAGMTPISPNAQHAAARSIPAVRQNLRLALRSTTYDVIVAGVGGMGSAACYHLARRGRRVLGIERFTVPNEMGSSHGITRIIRLAYFEDPRYVPLLHRAYDLWRQLEVQAGRRLLHVTGCLEVGRPDSGVVAGALRSCRLHHLAHEELTAADVNRRFPAWRLSGDLVAVLEPQGGFLEPEACIESHALLAADCGAEIHAGERVTRWEPVNDGVRVTTDQGVHEGRTLVLTAGAWAATLEPMLTDLAVPERQVLGWFDMARPERFGADIFPVFVADVEEGLYYGFPQHAVPGFKIGRFHHRRQVVSAEHVDRATDGEDEAVLRAFNRRYLPDADTALLDSRVCMFTNSPDEHFLIDRHPRHPQVLIAAGFSGHGYKFCSVVGEILADLAVDGDTDHSIEFLSLGRFRR